MRLKKKIIYTGHIELKTGLHIGGTNAALKWLHIGVGGKGEPRIGRGRKSDHNGKKGDNSEKYLRSVAFFHLRPPYRKSGDTGKGQRKDLQGGAHEVVRTILVTALKPDIHIDLNRLAVTGIFSGSVGVTREGE